MRRASALVSVAVVAAWATAARSTTAHASEDRPRPSKDGSYATYAHAVDDVRDAALAQFLRIYGAATTRDPKDDVAAVDRCRLLDAVLGRDDEEAPPNDPRLACRRALSAYYAWSPNALFYRLEHLYGDEKRDFLVQLLARRDVAWTDDERAELHRQLAILYDLRKKTAEATVEAHQALALDPTIDLSLIIGRELLAQGRPTEAVVQLSRPPASPQDDYFRQERARLLGEAGAPLRALALADTGHFSWTDLGTLDEKAGKLDQANRAYTKISDPAARHAALAHLFLRAIGGADAPVADRVYQSLRDLGWRADPYGGYRLALLRRFPSLPWHKRDVGGLAVLALAIVLFLLAPALWIVPLHHWSLWRRTRHGQRLPPPRLVTRWRLRHLWLGCAALLVAQLVAYVVFAYADAAAVWWHEANEKLPHAPREVARLGLCVVFGEVALLLAFVVRRRDWRLFGPGRWTVRQSVARASLTILAFFGFVVVWFWIVRARGAVSPGTVTIEELVRALRDTYGITVVVLLICVLGPIAEELVFRSLLLDVLTRSQPFWSANVLQALAFAAAHGELKKIPYLFGVGLLCGILRARSGGLLASITFHMLNNVLAMLVALHGLAAPSPQTEPAPVPASPLSLTAGAELKACVDRAPPTKDAAPASDLAPAVILNDDAWRIALDPQATPACLREAAGAVDRALTALPERAPILDTEATVFYRLGRVDEAIDLERATIERFDGGAQFYAQLGRFLRTRRDRWPIALGAGAAKGAQDVHVRVVGDPGAQALELDVSADFPDGVALYYQVFGAETQPGVLRVQLGSPPQPRSFRFPLDGSKMRLNPGGVRFALALIDSRGCAGCAAGSWYWSLQFPGTSVDGYP
ncbi:MAG TPA: CPBP family glutamic-type intramembrane protease [Polyangia bacterium]|nr:CPBP family glutamic-type intramembrane protease [Polyangia bacterium]